MPWEACGLRLPLSTLPQHGSLPCLHRLQVGYVSPDLFTHSVSYFAEAPLAHHSPQRVHHIVYSCVPKVRFIRLVHSRA